MRELNLDSMLPARLGHSRAAPRLAILLAALALILFPFGWLGEVFPGVGRALDRAFASETLHVVGHAALFALLGVLTLRVFPALPARPLRYFGLLILAGVGQECFQLLFKQRALVFDDARDLVVDLFGLAVAFAGVWLWESGAVARLVRRE